MSEEPFPTDLPGLLALHYAVSMGLAQADRAAIRAGLRALPREALVARREALLPVTGRCHVSRVGLSALDEALAAG